MYGLATEIEYIEHTIKELVVQQLGDKSDYDSTLKDLNPKNQQLYGVNNAFDGNNGQTGQGEQPLENIMKEALNYDSTLYKQALGID